MQAAAWRPFAQRSDEVLQLALAARTFSCRPSELICVDPSSSAALSFDLACSYRLVVFDNERDYARLKVQRRMLRTAVFEAVALHWIKDYKPPDDEESEDAEPPEDDLL